MKKEIAIDGKSCVLACTGLTPFVYRKEIGRDIVRDIRRLKASYEAAEAVRQNGGTDDEAEEAGLDLLDIEVFRDIAWVMLYQGSTIEDAVRMSGDIYVGTSPDDWLDHLDGIFSVYEVMEHVLDLWERCQRTTAVPAKK